MLKSRTIFQRQLSFVKRVYSSEPLDYRGTYQTPIVVMKTGIDLLRDPVTNKGTAFPIAERDQLGLRGLLPPVVKTIDQQMERIKVKVERQPDNIAKYMVLSSLQDRNETLFYKLLTSDLERYAPIIYTPTVGVACQEYGSMYRRPRGLYITPRDKNHILSLLHNWREDNVSVIVVTDGSRVLGLGDLGINGMAISIGKLALYTAAGGIDPALTLPIVLDVGTNNEKLLNDPDYLGLRAKRVDEQTYYELLDEFIWAVKVRWPNALLQFEDFDNTHAYPLLHKYRKTMRCFNDDIQGTGSVALAGLYASLRQMGLQPSDLKNQRIVCLGAGSAGLGVCNSIHTAMIAEGATPEQASNNFWLVDKDGLLTANRIGLTTAQKALSRRDKEAVEGMSLLDTVCLAKPTILLGLSGVGRAFTEDVVREVSKNSPRPIIFPLSNPTANAECTAEQAYEWTDGKAIFSSGSPFDPVEYNGKTLYPSQGNNMFIFPGVGLGAVLCGAERVSVAMFSAAAKALAECVSEEKLAMGKVYPKVDDIRQVSVKIAATVIRVAEETGLSTKSKPRRFETIEQWVETSMWKPAFANIVRKEMDHTL